MRVCWVRSAGDGGTSQVDVRVRQQVGGKRQRKGDAIHKESQT